MTSIQEKKTKLLALANDDSKVFELYQRINELSKRLEDIKHQLEAIEKKKTSLLTDS